MSIDERMQKIAKQINMPLEYTDAIQLNKPKKLDRAKLHRLASMVRRQFK